jgi:hypothetical protein
MPKSWRLSLCINGGVGESLSHSAALHIRLRDVEFWTSNVLLLLACLHIGFIATTFVVVANWCVFVFRFVTVTTPLLVNDDINRRDCMSPTITSVIDAGLSSFAI